MVLIDALYINNSGGKVLLDYLIHKFEETEIQVQYLLDVRIRTRCPPIKSSNGLIYLKPSIIKRHNFYKENKDRFSKVLCFGNLPPSIKINATVYTYFHQALFIEIPRSVPLKARILLLAKTQVLKFLKKNTTYFLVQSRFIKEGLVEKYDLVDEKVIVLPFYPKIGKVEDIDKEKNTFLYVSSGGAYKNHGRLIEAFCLFYKEKGIGKLILTVNKEFSELNRKIIELQNKGYPIINLGFVDKMQLANIYRKCEYLIFPSLIESFGLGLIEATQMGCKIIGADLPYLYMICKPSLVFDPLDVIDIKRCFDVAVSEVLESSRSAVSDEIDKLIDTFRR